MNQLADTNEHTTVKRCERLKASAQRIREQMILPDEWTELIHSEEKERLRVIIRTTASGQSIIHLAHQLTSRDLRLIFPILAEAAQTHSLTRQDFDKINLIIRERACPSLYRYGWSVFQATFPCQSVARALAVLSDILAIKKFSSETIDSMRFANRFSKRYPDLISDLAPPDSRHFSETLVKAMARMNLTLDDWIRDYDVQQEQPLAQAVMMQCFLFGAPSCFDNSQMYFDRCLSQSNEERQARLIKRLLSLDALKPETKNAYCQVVYRRFGSPDPKQPIWLAIRPNERRLFEHWILEAVIGTHCRKSPRKAQFYHRYAPLIQSVERWDETVLVIYFKGFIIADDQSQPLFAFYYDVSDPRELMPNTADRTALKLADVSLPHRRVEDALRRSSTHGIVALCFDEGIKASRSFIDFCLLEKKAASRRDIKNLAYRSVKED